MSRRSHLLFAPLLLATCAEPAPVEEPVEAIPGTQARFDLSAQAEFYAAPFPLMSRLNADSTLRVSDFPNPSHNTSVDDVVDALGESPVGFGTNAAIWFPFDGPIDASALPDPAASLAVTSPVFLVNVDESSPEVDERIPLDIRFKADAETYSPANLLVLLPRPGFAMRPQTWYAAVVTTGLRDAAGESLGSPLLLEQLKAGETQESVAAADRAASFERLWAHLERTGGARDEVRAATAFRTGDPYDEMDRLRERILTRPAPVATDLIQIRDHDSFCVLEGNVVVPLFQTGDRPYSRSGGEIAFDADGAPLVEAEETIRFSLSIPKQAMPANGFPLLFYSAGQGGAYTQVVDRGTFAEQRSTPGRGPAFYLADIGIASLSIEAPLVGPRHPSRDTSGFEFFNVANPFAFRDNSRQAALDFVTLVRLATDLQAGAALCPEATTSGGPFEFDSDHFLFYGHSTGATIGSILLGLEPDIEAGLLSGTGGSWIYNLTLKQAPLDFNGLVKMLLAFDEEDTPDSHDPVLSLAQTLWEPSEPINWSRRWTQEPVIGPAKDILIIEGVVDLYFPPPMVNALAIAARAEPVAPVVDDGLLEAIGLVGGVTRAAPAGPNHGERATLLVQHEAFGDLDGHYVPFEYPEPKYQYRCYFASLLAGEVLVPGPNPDPFAACPSPD